MILTVCLLNFLNGLNLYAEILHALNVEWSIKQKIHEENWKMFVIDEYDMSDYISKMLVDSCSTEEDFTFIERLDSLDERQGQRRGVSCLCS
jgi:hypothetical protein